MNDKQILKGLISAKVDELAKALPAEFQASFNQLDLTARICGIGFFAVLPDDKKIAQACSEWLKMIGA